MTQRTFVALLTVVVFAAGYLVRSLTDRGEHVPAPPAVLTNEGKQQNNRAKLLADLEKLKPQIESYRAQVDQIFMEFDREFVKLLDASQSEKFTANQKKFLEHESKRKTDSKPLTDDDITRARNRPFMEVYWMVTVTPPLGMLTNEYQLTEAQQISTRALLTLRRNKFSALLDGTPPPSIQLSRLAPMIERVAAPPKPGK